MKTDLTGTALSLTRTFSIPDPPRDRFRNSAPPPPANSVLSRARQSCIATAVALLMLGGAQCMSEGRPVVPLPKGVQAVWELDKAFRQTTATRERLYINGLWRWQPADQNQDAVPGARWGYFKVPGSWPGITDYMQKDCQTVYPHPSWKDENLGGITAAWYQREITIPREWAGRRIALCAEYVNSFAIVYVDGEKAGEIRFPAGEADLTAVCRPGGTYVLSLLVAAMPLKGVMLSYNDTASARKVKGRVARRGLCGDVSLTGTPTGPCVRNVKVDTSVRKWEIAFGASLDNLTANEKYTLRARITDNGRRVAEFTSKPFGVADVKGGRFVFVARWKPQKLWDIHTPQNMFRLGLSLLGARGELLDAAFPSRVGFREFWIDGRDFFLNGTRIFLSSVPLDNAQVGAAWANYAAARESMERLQSFGINFVYTHNYGCQPGSHLSFAEILRAADDVGMLVALSQPHFGHYDWDGPEADKTNGYARHAAFYVRVAQNHPSVVAYATSHNATGYAEDMNPDLIDGVHARRNQWAAKNVKRALRAEAIIRRLDPGRIVYHHASGNLGSMHTINFYANFVPIQEMSDWFEHWATRGVKPLFTCEYTVPMPWDWTMYRGWYKGRRAFGSAAVPWEFCVAEWNAQFFGDKAYRISQAEKENLRWEAEQFRAGKRWRRWDYPHPVGSRDFADRYPVYAMYFSDNWPAFRTWGVSANSPWNHGHYWTLRSGVDKRRKELEVDWNSLQRPGFSPDYIEDRYERMDLAFKRSDWIPTVAARALIRNNRPLLAYIAGKPAAFTGKDHNFVPGEMLEKQLVVINNSRTTVTGDCRWSLGLPKAVTGETKIAVATGEQRHISLRFELPDRLPPGTYRLNAAVTFGSGETQEDSFAIHVLAQPAAVPSISPAPALFDPAGETGELLDRMGVRYRKVDPGTDLSGYDMLIVGKHALTVHGSAPDITGVRKGLKVLVFEQTQDALEQRLGFRVAVHGLRRVFKRVPDHPLLAGIAGEYLRNWRGEATTVASRLEYKLSPRFSYAPTVRWCGIPVTRLWRCGNRGNVASVLIEKPPRGDFLPVLDGGYSLQYSPLIEYREGRGMVLFCQMDVTGRTENDPAAETLAQNMLEYLAAWKPSPRRRVVYAGNPAGRKHLESAGISPVPYEADKLTDDEILVVAPGGGHELAGSAAAVADWLKFGGRLLAVGLDEQEASAFLPVKVGFEVREHIAAWFEPFGVGSPFAGVAPADVHNAAPRKLPLVARGATVVGDGVLGMTEKGNVVFCQLAPWTLDQTQHNLKRTYRRTGFLLARLLANMGAAGSTPLLERFSVPVGEDTGASLIKNGDFSADADGDGRPDEWLFSSSSKQAACKRRRMRGRAGEWALALSCPPHEASREPSTMLAQSGVPVKKGQWYRIAFKARAERLAAKSVSVTITNTAVWRSFFESQRFRPESNWRRFSFEVQSNDTAARRTRFQIWYVGAGKLWLADVRVGPINDPTEGRWLEGLYLDSPEEWDDPYRFFRW
ncbi:MAG: hypothetical protein GXP31_07225 [Kiritimatiellaeota bacterium]|nr:hypothetical protein [Kiritimatiellota bacterium]